MVEILVLQENQNAKFVRLRIFANTIKIVDKNIIKVYILIIKKLGEEYKC